MGSYTPSDSLLYKNFHRHPALVVESGSGIYLNIDDGRRILDATSGAAVACLGYSEARVQKALVAQASKLAYCHPGFYKAPVAEDLANFLIETTHGQMAKAALCGSGSEAVEVALKLAKTYFAQLTPPQPTRNNFIARVGAWHGATLGALSLGDFKCRKDPFITMIPQNVTRVSACSTYRGLRQAETIEQYVERLAQELEDEFQRLGPETVCAFVAETVGGSASGCAVPVPGYFKAMKEVCDRHGALMIFDEIMCGMGRTGTLHAWEQEDVVPDLQTVGKGLGSGYGTVSAVLVKDSLVRSLKDGGGSFAHGQTYMAHPLSAAAALEVQKIIQEDNIVDNVYKMGKLLEHQLRSKLESHPFVGDIRGRGLFWTVEFVANKETKAPFSQELKLADKMHSKGLSRGYEVAMFNATGSADGYAGDHIVLAPPYIVQERDVNEIVDRVSRVVNDVFEELALM